MPEPYRLVAAVAFGLVTDPNIKLLRAELKEHGLFIRFEGNMQGYPPQKPSGWRLHVGYSRKRKNFTAAFGTLRHVCRTAVKRAHNPERLPTDETLEPEAGRVPHAGRDAADAQG